MQSPSPSRDETRVSILHSEKNLARRVVPTFLIIGAQRSGTTSLYWNLCEHPLIIPSSRKEVHYFDHRFDEDPNWYYDHFPSELAPRQITGEASPSYLLNPLAASRAASTLPDAKIIAIFRNPIDRAFSHYRHELRRKHEPLSFEEALDQEESRLEGERDKLLDGTVQKSETFQFYSYCHRGMYAQQLEVWLKFFPREQLHVVISENFFQDRLGTLNEIARFLDLPPMGTNSEENFKHHNFGGKSELTPATRRRLASYFGEHNSRLADLLDMQLPWDEK